LEAEQRWCMHFVNGNGGRKTRWFHTACMRPKLNRWTGCMHDGPHLLLKNTLFSLAHLFPFAFGTRKDAVKRAKK
jgi:hypothetical protein